MRPSDWAFYIGIKAIEWLNPLVHIIGLAVSIWAYRASRRPGYLVVAAYFALATFTLTVSPAISRARHRAWQAKHELTPEQHEAYWHEYSALDKKYYPLGHGPSHLNINFPFGPILLVAGLWLIARREPRIAEPNAGGNAAPPRASA